MSITQLLARQGAADKSRRDAASGDNNATRESASELARRLATNCIVLDCETTGFGERARMWELVVNGASHDMVHEQWMFNPGLLVPTLGGAGSQYEWDSVAYYMAVAAIGQPEIPGSKSEIIDPVAILANMRPFAEWADQIIDLLTDRDVVAWNADFDQGVLLNELRRMPAYVETPQRSTLNDQRSFSHYSQRFQMIRWWDAMPLYLKWRLQTGRPVMRDEGGYVQRYKLHDACVDEGIAPEASHRAASGVRCCVELLKRMAG